jgi:hypothetical protein
MGLRRRAAGGGRDRRAARGRPLVTPADPARRRRRHRAACDRRADDLPGADAGRALAAHEPAIAADDARAHRQLEELIAADVRADEWPTATDPVLAARLFTAGLYGLMAQWQLAPGSFSWEHAAAALVGHPAAADSSKSDAYPPGPGQPPAVSVASGEAR